jgi:threonine/homoserine/homoserine lactone efflux protein
MTGEPAMDEIARYLPGIALAYTAFLLGIAVALGTGVLSVVFLCFYALAFSTAPMVRFYGRARRWIQATLGGFFAFAGVKLLTSRL